MKSLIFYIVIVLSVNSGFSQKFNDIKFNLANYENDTLLLAYFYGEKQLIKDTLFAVKKGTFEYKADSILDPGVYIGLVYPNKEYFQFLVNENELKFTDFIVQTMKNIEEILSLKPRKVLIASEIENDNIKNAFGTHKLREICKTVDANIYISGANGSVYGADAVFTEGYGIKLKYNNPINIEYQQPNQEKFIPFMGFFDYIFCMGVDRVREIITSPLILIDN